MTAMTEINSLGRRSRYGTVAVLVVVALVAAAAWFVHWRDDLRYFGGVGSEVGMRDLPVGKTIYFGAFVSPTMIGRQVDVQALTPIVTRNSQARIRLLLCTSSRSIGIGSAEALEPYCASTSAFRPGNPRFGEASADYDHPVQSVVVAITPTSPGRVHIAGLLVRYADGIRFGVQLTGSEMDAVTHSG